MRSPSAVALFATAVVAIVQAALFATLVGSQRDVAHIIDISGLQRMQSQRIAFLALAAHDGSAAPGWRTEMDRALATMAAGRRELTTVTAADPVSDRLASRYERAAREIERGPQSEAAYATIRDLRPLLLRRFQAAVESRVADRKSRNDLLVKAMLAGVCLQLLVIGLSWLALSRPQERRIATLLRDTTARHDDMESLFEENPDAIAIYDERGRLVRVNRARAALGGHGREEHVGRHYTALLHPDVAPIGPAAFERALAGESSTIETRFRADSGELIAVKMTFFPNVVRGRNKGVIVVAKDIRALKLAESLYAEQSQRIADLYAIAAAHGKSMRGRIAEALALAATRLGYEWASASEIATGASGVVATFGDQSAVAPGAHEGLHRAIVNQLVNPDDIWCIDDFSGHPWMRGTTLGTFKAMTGMRIEADGTLYGSFAFASSAARTKALSEGDRDFLRLVAALLGSIIERDQRERKLDSLAFFDALTGLPNRVLLLDRLEEHVTAARRRNVHFSLFYIDLDRFKAINDGAGHSAGDAVLRIVARRLEQAVRESDTVARLSGDEFVILRSSVTGVDEFAQRVVHVLGEPMSLKEGTFTVGASVGIALFPHDGESGMDLLAAADAALYHAKRNGRNRFAYKSDVAADPAPLVRPLRRKTPRKRSLQA